MTTPDPGSSLVAAAVISYIIGVMKDSGWRLFKWISHDTPRVNRLVAIVLSGIASVGIHWTFSGGTLVITGLGATLILTALWHWGYQFVYTHGWFKATSQSSELLDLVKDLVAQQLNKQS